MPTPSRHVRLSDDHWAKLAELGRRVAPQNPVKEAEMIRRLIDQAYEQETTDPRKSARKP